MQRFETGGKWISYEEHAPESTGEIILMAPGIGDLRQEYRKIAPLLAGAGYRPVSMDLRGMGQSSIAWDVYTPEAVGSDMLALARHLGNGPVWLMGCSMAAASAAWVAVEAPERVRGIVLLGPSLENPALGGLKQVMLDVALAIGMRGPWKVRFWETFYRSLYPHRKPDDLDDYCRQLRANLAEAGRFATLRAFMSAPKDACFERIPLLSRPALVIMGASDPDYSDPAGKARHYAELLRGEAVVVEGAGHYPHADSPTETFAAILTWMNNLEQQKEYSNGAAGT